MSVYYDDYAHYPAPSPSSSTSSANSLSRFRHTSHRATKAADLACLLDPSYTHPMSSSSSPHQVYVDHAGETHDPDFRLFNYSPKRRAREFLSVQENEDDDEVAWYEEQQREEQRRRRPSFEDEYAARPGSRASDPAYYAYTSSPLTTHFDFEYAREERGYLSDEEPSPRVAAPIKKLKRRRTPSLVDGGDALPPTSESTPSPLPCSPCASAQYTFRRSWHALTLRTQVAAYRARKKMQSLVHVGRSNTI